jgi:hypothetical protein
MTDRRVAGLVSLDADADAVILALGKEEAAILFEIIGSPPVGDQRGSFREHGGPLVDSRCELHGFDRTTEAITQNEPARLVAGRQGIHIATSSSSHKAKHAKRYGVLSKPETRVLYAAPANGVSLLPLGDSV